MKNFLLPLFIILMAATAQSQEVTWELSAEPGDQAFNNATFQATDFVSSVLLRGPGVDATSGAGSMSSAAWFEDGSPTTLDQAIDGEEYYEFSVNTTNCLFFKPVTIDIVLSSSASGPNKATLRSSTTGFSTNIGTVTVGTTATLFTFTDNLTILGETAVYRLYGYGSAADGGSPAAAGIMRIGSSTNAAATDLEVTSTTSPLAIIGSLPNLTTLATNSVTSIPFSSNLPGITIINWSRTPEPIGLPATSGTGNVPNFVATNNTGAPLVCTFTVNATSGTCLSADRQFTFTVNPLDPPVPCPNSVEAWDLSQEPGDQASSEPFFMETGIGSGTLTGGAGLTPSSNLGTMTAIGWYDSSTPTTLAEAIANNDYYEFTLPVDVNKQAVVNAVSFFIVGNPGSPRTAALRSSADNFATTLGSTVITTNPTLKSISFSAITQLGGVLSFRLYCFGETINANSNPNPSAGVRIGDSGNPSAADLCILGTVSTPPCGITSLTYTNSSTCNDNGSSNDSNDDFYTADIVVNFASLPATGNLRLTGPAIIGTYSIPVSSLLGNSHTFPDVMLVADGQSTVVTALLTDHPNCATLTKTSAGVASCSTLEPCDISNVALTNPGPCNDNGTPNDPTDDFFTADVLVSFSNPPATGQLVIFGPDLVNGSIAANIANVIAGGSPFPFSNVRFKADGGTTSVTASFSAEPTCTFALSTTIAVQPCSGPCSMIDLDFPNQGPCDDNGTPNDPTDDFFTEDITVIFDNPPSTGLLELFGSDLVPGGGPTSVAVSAITGNEHTFTGVRYRADGQTTTFSARFTAESSCLISFATFLVVEPCSYPAPILTCPPGVTVSCAGEVPPIDPASVSETHSCPGDVTIIGIVPEFITGQTCTNRFSISRAYQATDACGNVKICSQSIIVDDQSGPSVTCPPNVTVSCASQVPLADITSVNVSDNCSGSVTIVNFPSDGISNQTCANKFTITRSYFAIDGCGNSNNCIQTITVNDQTPPSLTCPAAQTVSCLGNIPTQNIALVTGGSDNCGGAAPTVTFVSEVSTDVTCANRFTLTRLYRATDACGNSATCSQVITVNDQTPPTLACPAGQTVSCAANVPTQNSSLVTGLSDNCGGVLIVATFVNDAISNQTCANRFTLTRTYRATDECGNSATCSQVITVNDQTAPA